MSSLFSFREIGAAAQQPASSQQKFTPPPQASSRRAVGDVSWIAKCAVREPSESSERSYSSSSRLAAKATPTSAGIAPPLVSSRRSWSTKEASVQPGSPRSSFGSLRSQSVQNLSFSSTGASGCQTPQQRDRSEHSPLMKTEILDKVEVWQTEVDSLEQKQVRNQADQMIVLHSQIGILTRELGDLQKQFVSFGRDVTSDFNSLRNGVASSQEEAQAALRLGLAEMHSLSLSAMENLHSKRYAEHEAAIQDSLQDVHSMLQKELADIRSGHAIKLKQVITEVTAQVDKLTVNMEQMAEDLSTAQAEAHSSLRLEFAEHCNNIGEMRAVWEESQKALSNAMDDRFGKLAAEHAKALEDHTTAHAKALEDHASRNHISIAAMEKLHEKRYVELEATLEDSTEDVRSTLQRELRDLKARQEVSIRQVIKEVATQVDKVTEDVEQMTRDVANAQEEAHSALRLELVEHGQSAAEMRAAWEEAHSALSARTHANTDKLNSVFGNMQAAMNVKFRGDKPRKARE